MDSPSKSGGWPNKTIIWTGIHHDLNSKNVKVANAFASLVWIES